ncbi:MAG: FHA domain-containing protein [Chloroflexi bacterium]|jgi:pSer/pThr/pTyr-binding forkhead associated (FHA) protein|nr:MAG: FHA domain-containing protein [Chloroflexota bacterium]
MTATIVLILRLLLAIALYAFLGWALWTLLQEFKQQGDKLAVQRKPAITLYIKIERGKENVRRFLQSEIMIGRDPNCDLSFMDEALSAHHARLAHHHGQWWLEDLNSTNGTFLNREKLTTSAVVITGDQFKCGNTVFGIQVEDSDGLSPTKAS